MCVSRYLGTYESHVIAERGHFMNVSPPLLSVASYEHQSSDIDPCRLSSMHEVCKPFVVIRTNLLITPSIPVYHAEDTWAQQQRDVLLERDETAKNQFSQRGYMGNCMFLLSTDDSMGSINSKLFIPGMYLGR